MTEPRVRIASALSAAGSDPGPHHVLATALAVPPLITWEHLRTVRRQLFGTGSLAMELDLMESGLVDSCLRAGFTFHPLLARARRELLRELIRDQPLDGISLLPPPGSLSPLLAIEADLVHSYLTREDFAEHAETVLRDVLMTLTQESRLGIRDWAAGAMHRIPRAVAATSAGYLLCRICGILTPVNAKDQLPIDLDFARRLSGFLPNRLLALHRDGEVTNIGLPSRKRAHAVSIPSLPGVPVRFSWSGENGPETHLIDLTNLPVILPTGTCEVTIEDISGTVHVLEAFKHEPPESVALAADLDRLAHAWSTKETVPVRIVRQTPGGVVVRPLIAPSMTAFVQPRALERHANWTNTPDPSVRMLIVDTTTRVAIAEPVIVGIARPADHFAVGQQITGTINGIVGYGAFVTIGPGFHALLHNSEIPTSFTLTIGAELELEVVRVDADTGRVSVATVPRRAATVQPRGSVFRVNHPEEADVWWDACTQTFEEGSVELGHNIRPVAIGCYVTLSRNGAELEALLHNSEIPESLDLEPGGEIHVRVLKLNREGSTVSLYPPDHTRLAP